MNQTGLGVVKAAVSLLRGEDLTAVPDMLIADEIHDLHWALEQLHGELLRRLAVFDSHAGALPAGHLTTASWLREYCLMTAAQAKHHVGASRAVRDGTPVGEALERGDISMAQAA